jgi:hypothetical protein
MGGAAPATEFRDWQMPVDDALANNAGEEPQTGDSSVRRSSSARLTVTRMMDALT